MGKGLTETDFFFSRAFFFMDYITMCIYKYYYELNINFFLRKAFYFILLIFFFLEKHFKLLKLWFVDSRLDCVIL